MEVSIQNILNYNQSVISDITETIDNNTSLSVLYCQKRL